MMLAPAVYRAVHGRRFRPLRHSWWSDGGATPCLTTGLTCRSVSAMTTTLIFVSTATAGRYHWGEQRQTAGSDHWIQACGMSRRQTYSGSPVELTAPDREFAQRHADRLICGKCFPGRILPTVASMKAGKPQAPQVTAGARFSTSVETGCVAQSAPDEFGNFDGLDSEGVECLFTLGMVTEVY